VKTFSTRGKLVACTLVLKPGLLIYRIYNGYWFWGRPSVVDLWHDLRAVTSEIRPDWDLDTLGYTRFPNAPHQTLGDDVLIQEQAVSSDVNR